MSRSNSGPEMVADLDIGFGGKLALAHAIGNLPYSSIVTEAKVSLIWSVPSWTGTLLVYSVSFTTMKSESLFITFIPGMDRLASTYPE